MCQPAKKCSTVFAKMKPQNGVITSAYSQSSVTLGLANFSFRQVEMRRRNFCRLRLIFEIILLLTPMLMMHDRDKFISINRKNKNKSGIEKKL